MSGIAMMLMAVSAGASGSSDFVFNQTISADTQHYNLRAAAVTAGWDQVKPLKATITINSGIVVSANSTSLYAFDTGTTFPAGTTLALINNGVIVGMGGAGAPTYPRQAGGSGGPALRVQHAITITNNGTIAGGGGGGGSGAVYDSESDGELYGGGQGGGGRTGRTNSAGCAAYSLDSYPGATYSGGSAASASGAGTYSAAGAAGSGGTTGDGFGPGGSGGAGGGWGSAGGAGVNSTAGGSGYEVLVAAATSGGGAGSAVSGNSNITWAATGTRLGAIA